MITQNAPNVNVEPTPAEIRRHVEIYATLLNLAIGPDRAEVKQILDSYVELFSETTSTQEESI